MTRDQPTTAIALRYEAPAPPVVTAKAKGAGAESIIELAKTHGIPLYDDPELAGLLAKVPLGDHIPVALYAAVAEVIAFVYLMAERTDAV
jgi:flagellar biosynthesis protein